MERQRVTANLVLEVFGILCIPIALIISVSNYQLNISAICLIVLIILFPLYLLYYLYTLKTIEFDEDFTYIISVNGNEEKVPFENIKMIKLSIDGINNKSFWRMKYVNSNNEEKSITFVAKVSLKSLSTLIDKIKSKNPNVIFKNFATSFDLD